MASKLLVVNEVLEHLECCLIVVVGIGDEVTGMRDCQVAEVTSLAPVSSSPGVIGTTILVIAFLDVIYLFTSVPECVIVVTKVNSTHPRFLCGWSILGIPLTNVDENWALVGIEQSLVITCVINHLVRCKCFTNFR
jgi:hypothetical protein